MSHSIKVVSTVDHAMVEQIVCTATHGNGRGKGDRETFAGLPSGEIILSIRMCGSRVRTGGF